MRLFMAILLSALALVAASPTLPPRACSTIYPNIYSLVSSQPDEPAAPVAYNQSTALAVGGVSNSEDLQAILQFPHLQIYSQPSSPSDPQGSLQYLDFQVPAGSYGCQLSIIDENNQLYFNNYSNINAPPPVLNVMSLFANAICNDPTYNAVLKANPSVIETPSWGTFNLSSGESTVINSADCPPASEGEDGHAQFVLEFAQPDGGYSDWILPQLTAIDAGLQISEGIYMNYNC
jgi:hypothetical protein